MGGMPEKFSQAVWTTFKKCWMLIFFAIWELIKDRLAAWANTEIDTAAEGMIDTIKSIVSDMASAPLSNTVSIAFIVIIIIFAHSYWKEINVTTPAPAPEQKRFEPDWSIGEAIAYVVAVLYPDSDPSHINYNAEYKLAPEELVKKIKSGDLLIWGKQVQRRVGTSDLTVNIDQEQLNLDDWKHRELLPLEASIPTAKNPQTRSVGRSDDHIQFTDLYVNESQVKGVDWRGESNEIPYLLLSEAGRTLYGDLREFDKDHWHVKLAESFDDMEDGILTYFAICISLHGEIFGKRPPSNRLEKIDQEEWKRGHFKDKGNEFWYFNTQKPRYIEMVVDSSDLLGILEILTSQTKLEN